MTEQALKKLEEQLQCSICLDTYTDPKQLHCNHVYCRKCLVRLVIRDQQGQLILTCPISRQVTPVVPTSGVAGLQSAFHINHLLEIQDSFKKISDVPATSVVQGQGAVGSSESEDRGVKHCFEHQEELRLYCDTCEALICFQCAIKGGKHHSHDYELLEKAFDRYKGEITSSLEPMEKQLEIVNKALAQLDARCGEISDQQEAIEADIHDSIRRLHEFLDARKTELIYRLHQITQAKLKDLAVQKDQIETIQAQLSSCLEFMRESLKTGNQREKLIRKEKLVTQMKELATTSFQPNMLKPNSEANMRFLPSGDVTALCQSYGEVITSLHLDPSKCHIAGKVVETVAVGEKSTILLQAADFRGEPCKEVIQSIECELVSDITGTRKWGSVERRGQSEYEIIFQPSIKGSHQLYIWVESQHIRGSPFPIAATSPVENIKVPMLTIGNLHGPYDVAINQQGYVVVTERTNHRITIFRNNGEIFQAFGGLGSTNGQFKYPRGVAIDSNNNILVVDTSNRRIQKFTSEGQFLAAVTAQDCSGSLPIPNGIAVNPANKKIYVTFYSSCIQVLNSDLTYSSTFGKDGAGNGQFQHPCGIACDSSGRVYVADSKNHRVQVFTSEGHFLRVIGRRGEKKGEFIQPKSVAVDTCNRLYVGDRDNNRVSVFTPEGQFVTSFSYKEARVAVYNFDKLSKLSSSQFCKLSQIETTSMVITRTLGFKCPSYKNFYSVSLLSHGTLKLHTWC